jgi:hypothetical protein
MDREAEPGHVSFKTTANPIREAGGRETAVVPRRYTLDGFIEETSAVAGLDMAVLEPFTTVLVRTENTLYRLVVLNPSEHAVVVQGGSFFGESTTARLAGSSYGGSVLKLGWIGLDLRMEFCAAGRRIVTSPVKTIRVAHEAAGPF